MNKKIFTAGELSLVYVEENGTVGFTAVPTKLVSRIKDEKLAEPKPVVQVALCGEEGEREYFNGLSMQMGETARALRLVSQESKEDGDRLEVVTSFRTDGGLRAIHHAALYKAFPVVECYNELVNDGDDVTVEMICSASVGFITPFRAVNEAERLNIYRMRTAWSAEAKLDVNTAADLQLEDVWSGSYGLRQDRIGQAGSMPCRRFMPFYAVEDADAGCVWAMSVEAPGGWQIDAMHYRGSLSLTGGLCDFESGHFRKLLRRGEKFVTRNGFITAVAGGFDEACASLQRVYDLRAETPNADAALPVIYNEYCRSWGRPTSEQLFPQIDECARMGLGVFVIDAGWWTEPQSNWYTLGDWEQSRPSFPRGIKEVADYARSRGLIPGVWMEFEGASTDSKLFREHPEYFLTRDGHIVVRRERALLDFRKPEVRQYAFDRTVKLLRGNGFGYMKLDYNEGLGIGCDGAESYGEGMREHIECVIDFIREIKREFPELILEICSSGGHRLEPTFLSLAAQASFSDAHTEPDGAVIAADLHRYMLPRQMQVWATLKKEYSPARTAFTLAKGMLGRLCLSGDLTELSAAQTALVEGAAAFYAKIKRIIKEGDTLVNVNDGVTSLKPPRGTRYLIRYSRDRRSAVLYAFKFAPDGADGLTVTHPALADMSPSAHFACGTLVKSGESVRLDLPASDSLASFVVLLEKK